MQTLAHDTEHHAAAQVANVHVLSGATKRTRVLAIACCAVWLLACGGDSAAKKTCPDGSVCTAGTGGDGLDAGTGSGGSSGNSGSADSAVGSGNAGTSGAADGGGASGNGGAGSTQGVDKPKADGSELAACDPADATTCDMGLACYTAERATPVGFCTKTCTMDTDCTALGADFTCSSPGQNGGMQYCRQACTGVDDMSCPQYMSCQAVQGGFRCLYDAKDVGSGTAGAWDKCTQAGDCMGDLVCYPTATQGGGVAYQGACTAKCMMDSDCSAKPSTGTIAPTCGGGGNCVLNCGGGGGGGMMMMTDGGGPQCPTGMTCANLGGGRQRCMYVDTNGGI